MRAMLLAAGKGERMRPLSLHTPKPLLPVGDRPLIDWHLDKLSAAGVTDVTVNVSWLGEQIRAHCGDGSAYGLRIVYSPEEEPLETAGGIIAALPGLGESPFLVLNADIFTDFPLQHLIANAPGPGAARLVLVSNPSHNSAGDFSLSGDRVLPKSGATLTYAGIGVYDPAFFRGFAPGKRPLRPLLESAIREERLFGEHYRGLWTDVGTPERLEQLREHYKASLKPARGPGRAPVDQYRKPM